MPYGKLITFEGCEGVGKSTQINLLKEYLEKHNIPCLFTREPGGTAVGERIRSILKDETLSDMFDETELLLFEAARVENTRGVVIPALNSGKIVVIDRYVDSTTAYQAYGRGIDRNMVEMLNDYAMCGVKIDITIFLNAPAFANTLREANDRMELSGEDFHKRVYNGFKEIERGQDRFVSVTPCAKKEDTADEIVRILKERNIL